MRLFDAILDANHRALAGDQSAGVHIADFADELPVIALTCIDPRLNAYFPNALALPAEKFIWLRNAGNIITGPLSSTMRSLALACAVKGGKEIAIIGHTDCQVAKTTTMQLLEKLKALGVDRAQLPENLNEFFGMFAMERQNVIKACDFVRHSPLIGPRIPVHGLLADIETGKLEWIVNGYNTLPSETLTSAR
jgi:carbonic anhydrase